MKTKAKVLLYDVESLPNKGFFWAGRMYDTNIIETVDYGGLASVAWKWLGESKIHCVTREGQKDDRRVVEKLRDLFDEADITIAHNGNSFDTKTSNTGILKHGLLPPSPCRKIDTKLEAKKYFRFDSNSLNELCKFLGIGKKLKHEGFDMWKDCMAGVPAAWQKMAKYNKHDVVLLEQVYLKLRPWMESHPNVATIEGRPQACSKCGSSKFKSHDIKHTQKRSYRRYLCKSCGGYFT